MKFKTFAKDTMTVFSICVIGYYAILGFSMRIGVWHCVGVIQHKGPNHETAAVLRAFTNRKKLFFMQDILIPLEKNSRYVMDPGPAVDLPKESSEEIYGIEKPF